MEELIAKNRRKAEATISDYLSDCREKNINPLCNKCLREYLDTHYGLDTN